MSAVLWSSVRSAGDYIDMTYLDATRVSLDYELPLNEIIYDFFDALKSRTRGYASFDYEFAAMKDQDLVKLICS